MDFLPALERIEAKLDRLISGPESPIVGRAEVMRLTGTKSTSAMHAALKRLNVQPFAKGKYRRADITNAIARISLGRAAQQRADLEHERTTEAQRISPKVNRHDN